MSEKISKIEAMYRFYKANPAASNGEVGQALGLSGDMVRTYKNRLKRNGLIYIEDDGRVSTEPEPDFSSVERTYKSDIYVEMIDTYMGDFRGQDTFADRLAVGREIRLLLEKL